MSSEAVTLQGIRAEAETVALDEKLTEAARALLRGGPVCFKRSTRVDAGLLPWWKRHAYTLACRKLLGAPPAPAMQLSVYTSWEAALGACQSPDDQLLAMPLDRSYSANVVDVSVECRPKDPADAGRTAALESVYAGYRVWGEDEGALFAEIGRDVDECRRVARQLRT